MTPIFDTCSFVPTPEILQQWFEVISKSRAYMRVFWKGFAYWADLDRRQYFDLIEGQKHEQAVAVLAERISHVRSMTSAQFVRQMDEANVETSVIHNYDCETFLKVKPLPFEYHAEIARRHPGRFKLLAGVDPLKGRRAVDMLAHAVNALGYHGLVVVPFRHGVPADHEVFKPLYRECIRLGVPVWIHSTTNWDPAFPIDLSSPRVIDRLAIEFQDLRIMAGHAGWPWVLEMVTVAWRHPNVTVEFSAFQPKSLAQPGFGFEPLLQFGLGPLRNKIMVGSTWNLVQLPLADIYAQVRALPGVTEDTADRWIYTNARAQFERS